MNRPQIFILTTAILASLASATYAQESPRTRTLIVDNCRFTKGDPVAVPISLNSDIRPAGRGAAPTDAVVAKPWILPTANPFINDPAKQTQPPAGNLGDGIPYIAAAFDDSAWQLLNLPHDSAIDGP